MMRPNLRARISGKHGADRVKRRGEIDGENGVPFRRRELLDRRHMLNAGVVDEDVDRPERIARVGRHRCDLLRLREVGRRVDDADAMLVGETVARAFDLRRVAEAVQRHMRAPCGEGFRDAEADAAGRSGDDGDAVRKRTRRLYAAGWHIDQVHGWRPPE